MSSKVQITMPLLLTLAVTAAASAGPPWTSLLPFRRAEPQRERSLELTEEDGPWLILAANFSGEGAEKQAQELVQELRKRYGLPAYLHRKRFDFSDRFDGRSPGGQRTRMRYAQASSYDGIAVLIGDFPDIQDRDLERTLEKIKHARPDCLDFERRGGSTQRFVGLRQLYRRMNGDESKRKKGPMGSAFVTRNPMLPQEYFAEGGVDQFVVDLNRGIKYSLLNNPGKVTVCVAKFRGKYTINMSEIAETEMSGDVSDALSRAADQAHRMTVALRKQKVEAYEFHDRHESLVTIGSFNSEGKLLADGKIDINPEIHKIMKEYGAARRTLPGGRELGLQPRSLNGIPFDIQPMPMKVPRRSVGGSYARARGLLFR